jgi:cyanate permease
MGLEWVHVLGGLGSLFGPPLFGLIVDRTETFQPAWIFAAVGIGLLATWQVRESTHPTA